MGELYTRDHHKGSFAAQPCREAIDIVMAAKNGKNHNDLRSMGIETVAVIGISALLYMGLYMLLMTGETANPYICGIFVIGLYLITSGGAVYLLERRKRGKTKDDTLAPVMGRIMFDAVVKMRTPVFICDSEEQIIWYNNATESLASGKNKLYGEQVSDLFGISLMAIKMDKTENGAKVSCEGRTFYARYNHIKTDDNDFAMITTTETTELDAAYEKMARDEPVVMYLIIDNLNEMMQYDSEHYRPAASKVDAVIRAWAEEKNCLLKEYERDKYVLVTETRVLNEFMSLKFDILDRVRATHHSEMNLPLTISIGVGNVSGSYEEKDKAAHTALEMALQRGGDQAVVKGNESMEFFGGITNTVQKRTNVRARMVSKELMHAIRTASNVIIMGHKFADFDAFGAVVGMARFAMFCGARVNAVINMADRNLLGCRNMLSSEEEFIGVFVDEQMGLDLLTTGTLVIVVDVNNMDHVESCLIAERAATLAVIDHHRKTAEFTSAPTVEYIEPSASSACELVAEMLEQILPREDLTATEATLMLAGITLDTKNFSKSTGTRTFSAALYLRDRGASPAAVQTLNKTSLDDYKREGSFRTNVEFYRKHLAITTATSLGETGPADRITAAKAADNLLAVEGVEASFALVKIGDTVNISARSAGRINVQLILEKLKGGGHYESAGAQVDGDVAAVVVRLKAAIDEYLAEIAESIAK